MLSFKSCWLGFASWSPAAGRYLRRPTCYTATSWPGTECVQPGPTEQTKVSSPLAPPLQLLAMDCSRLSSLTICSPRLFQQPIAKSLSAPHSPKQLNYFWKLNDMLGKSMLYREAGLPTRFTLASSTSRPTHSLPLPRPSRKVVSSATWSLYVFIAHKKICQATQEDFLYSRKPRFSEASLACAHENAHTVKYQPSLRLWKEGTRNKPGAEFY